jgi:hypothetical protein
MAGRPHDILVRASHLKRPSWDLDHFHLRGGTFISDTEKEKCGDDTKGSDE